MKRILSFILSLVLCFSLATVSLAVSADTTTTTTTNPDGSYVTAETKTEVVKHEDGSTSTIITTTTTNNPSSSFTGTPVFDKQSKVAIEVTLSRNASATTAETKEAVLLPISDITASTASADATTITIVTSTTMDVIVEIPVVDMNFGVVAVLVNEDGTETIIQDSMPSAYGVIITVHDGDTIKIIDNGGNFQDISEDDWYKSAVDYVSARKIMNGIGDCFAPGAITTRAQVWTMLARLDGVDTSVGETWYEVGRKWAMESGISDGTNHDGEITREQLITIIWRYLGEPESDYDINYFDDYQKISDWALSAMKWAASNGIITGTEGNDLNPDSQATRAHVAQIFYNFLFIF